MRPSRKEEPLTCEWRSVNIASVPTDSLHKVKANVQAAKTAFGAVLGNSQTGSCIQRWERVCAFGPTQAGQLSLGEGAGGPACPATGA